MIIDCHTHVNQYEVLEKVSTLEERLDILERTMVSNNVDYTLILSSYKVNSERPSTGQLIEATRKYDNLGIVAGFTITNHTDEDLKQYREWIKDGYVKGLKLYCGYEPIRKFMIKICAC